ncbi:hypothetical protein [Xenorhabdus griffiniae]|uniref:hypothetical protein n=1 Tax=Xenorhabdus griffiniae TaxID=351672 RepID=UPI002358F595|nr:hypothetical protein [Xenorhabdus griffiniae]MDC9607363.1 hypothetical protein [Xenorhabdus griffiniae]
MMPDISLLSSLGLLAAFPAIFITTRVAIRWLLNKLLPETKVHIKYTDVNKNTYKTTIYINNDDELMKLIDDIAEKNKNERGRATPHV